MSADERRERDSPVIPPERGESVGTSLPPREGAGGGSRPDSAGRPALEGVCPPVVRPEGGDGVEALRDRRARARRRLPWLIPARQTPTIAQLTLLLVVLGLLWRTVRYLLAFPLWGDESFVAVSFITRDFAGMIRPLEWGQIVSLGYMWATLAVTKLLGLGELPLRFVSYLTGALAVVLFWRFAIRQLPQRAALLAVGFLACSFYAVRHGAEVKSYTMDLLVALAMQMSAWAVWTRPTSLARWLALLLITVLAPWCSYPAIFIGGSIGLLLLWLVVQQRLHINVLAGLTAYGVLFAASAMAMIVFYAKPHAEFAAKLTDNPMWTMAFPPWADLDAMPGWLVLIHTGMMFAYPHGGHAGGSTATFVLFVIGCVWMWRRNRPLLLLLLAAFPLHFIAASFERYPYGGTIRTSIYLAPAICLLAGAGLYATLHRFLKGEQLRLGLLIAAGGFASFAIGGAIGDVARPYATDHSIISYRRTLEIVQATKPGDRWVAFNATEPKSYAPWLGDWRGIGAQWVFDMLRFNPTGEPMQWAPPAESIERPPDGTLWLFAYRGIKAPFPQRKWERYLATVVGRLGQPEHISYFIKERDGVRESIEAYRFEPHR